MILNAKRNLFSKDLIRKLPDTFLNEYYTVVYVVDYNKIIIYFTVRKFLVETIQK